MERSLESQSDDIVLKAFIDLAEHRPKFLRPELVKIFELMAKVDRERERERGYCKVCMYSVLLCLHYLLIEVASDRLCCHCILGMISFVMAGWDMLESFMMPFCTV